MARDLLELQAKTRGAQKKSDLKNMRKAGEIPGVLYGRHIDSPVSLSINDKDLKAIFKSESKHMAILKMDLGGQSHTSILKAIGRDPVTLVPIHLDFQTVDLKEKARFKVQVELANVEVATKIDLILQQPTSEIEIECLPLDCPLVVKVDVAQFAKDGMVAHVSDLPLGENIKLMSDPEAPVLVVQAPVAPPPPTEAELAAAAAKEAASKGKGKKK